MILIMLVMYILAILELLIKVFSSLGESFKTLFQLLTFDQWNDMVKEISTISNPAVTTTYILIWTCLGAFIFRNVFVGVMVNNFDKINDEMNEQRADLIKTKRFEHMRKKLNEELRIQGNINTSIDNLKRTVDDKKYYDKLEVENKRNQLGLNDSLLSYKVKKDNNSINFSNNLNEFDSKYNNSNISTQKLSSIKEEGWENTISNTLNGLLSKQKETIWPRDTLFKYLQIMENLQENMKEYQELQLIAAKLIFISS
ncbi:hypothetical protein LY90DRAFT_505530 [Neocallimastix californiae]|uniref:Ion transport domain-containing protein n=1 Tax=Neocallimastix californiae TaxID=1754190 RepID=A0A1Y2DRF4_9FUNG|nr:hypothetical protein LY90DRAFT_505530 [Neocallimastix californiae]|eukprot:ORY61817.1 hypothetical protein LY90DRAFT_505530 [Neocallimastix californiae]